MSDDTRPMALTMEQITKLSASISDVVCRNVGGLGHYRDRVAGWVEDELMGTPYDVGGEPAKPALAEVRPEADARVVDYLRRMLERAEAGELLAIALAGELTGREVVTGVAGEYDVFRILGALDMLKARIIAGCRVS